MYASRHPIPIHPRISAIEFTLKHLAQNLLHPPILSASLFVESFRTMFAYHVCFRK
jgi:hypothetical protein